MAFFRAHIIEYLWPGPRATYRGEQFNFVVYNKVYAINYLRNYCKVLAQKFAQRIALSGSIDNKYS